MNSLKRLIKQKNTKKIKCFQVTKWRLAKKNFIQSLQMELRSKQQNLFNFNKIIHELRDQIFKHLEISDLILFSQTNTCMQKLVNSFLKNQNIEASLYFYRKPAKIEGVELKNNEIEAFNIVNSVICYNGGGVEKLCVNFHALKNISKITFIGYKNYYHFDSRFICSVIFPNLKTVVIRESIVDTTLHYFLMNHQRRIQNLEIEDCIIEEFPKSIDFPYLKTFKCVLSYRKCKIKLCFFARFICESNTLEKVFVNKLIFKTIINYIISDKDKNMTTHRIKSLTVFPCSPVEISSYLNTNETEKVFKKIESIM